jgi:hypothetical protein
VFEVNVFVPKVSGSILSERLTVALNVPPTFVQDSVL